MKRWTTAAPVDDARIDQAARESMRSVSDVVLKMDRRQANPETKRVCPATGKGGKTLGHGALGVSGDGQWLICGLCEHREGISRSEIEQLEKEEARVAAELAAAESPAASVAEEATV